MREDRVNMYWDVKSILSGNPVLIERYYTHFVWWVYKYHVEERFNRQDVKTKKAGSYTIYANKMICNFKFALLLLLSVIVLNDSKLIAKSLEIKQQKQSQKNQQNKIYLSHRH